MVLCSERRDVSEIEITPEMIEAGENALCSCDDAFSLKADLEWIATSVFLAMYTLSPTETKMSSTGVIGRSPLAPK